MALTRYRTLFALCNVCRAVVEVVPDPIEQVLVWRLCSFGTASIAATAAGWSGRWRRLCLAAMEGHLPCRIKQEGTVQG